MRLLMASRSATVERFGWLGFLGAGNDGEAQS
jgi:hypothetical protein